MVTAGGIGSVSPSAADLTDSVLTLRFARPVCPGSRPGGGESSYFIGFASPHPPHEVDATVGLGATPDETVRTRAPQAPAPPAPGRDGCVVGVGPGGPFTVPIPRWTPLCRCLSDASLREFRCAFPHPDLVVVWRLPLPVVAGDPFAVDWLVVPLRDGAEARVELASQGGFQAIGRRGGKLSWPKASTAQSAVGTTWLLAPPQAGTHRLRAHLDVGVASPQQPSQRFELEVTVPVAGKP